MRTYIVFIGAMIAILLAGCGEGPLYPEDTSVLASTSESVSDEPDSDTSSVSEAEKSWDPDVRKRQEEEEKEQEEEEQKQEDTEKSIENATDAIDEMGSLLNQEKIEDAKKMWDDNVNGIKQMADSGMLNDNPEVAKLYKQWWEALVNMRQSLDKDDVSDSKKSKKAIDMLVAAGRFKQAAKQMEIFER